MAISYDDWKKQYEGMTTEQQKNYASMVKGNATAEAYAKQYIQEKQNAGTYGLQTATSYTNANQSTNTSTSNNYSSNSNNQNGTTYDYSSNNNTSSSSNNNNNTGTTNTGTNNNGGSPLSDGKNGNGGTYGKFTFDADEYLDESKFGKSNGEISVKEGTAAQTGRPDYELESKERLTEMVNNLNTYWDTNPEFFNDRETFNRVFEYNTRQSQAQRDLLDSYWKKAQDYKKASSYNNSASFTSDLDSGNVSESEFEALKKYNQDVYIQWQKDMQDKLNAAIANLANPFSIDDMTTALNSIVEKFNLQAGDPYDIIGGWNQMMEKTGAWDSMKQAQQHYAAADDAIAQIKRIQTNYSSSTGGNQSDALVAARLQKALLPYETLLSNELSAGQHWQSLYQTQLGTANNYASTINMQAQEDQRIFDNKLKALGFAMEAYSYRTPEQQAQLSLQVSQISQDMALLNQSKANDLALYNQYATAKLQNQLNYEMQDLTVTDPKQLRANLNNVLDQWYEQYGDIIQRPKSQVIEDVIAYAKANNMSVGEALRKNFIEPLMSKDEYKAKTREEYGMNPTYTKISDSSYLVQDPITGTISVQTIGGVGGSVGGVGAGVSYGGGNTGYLDIPRTGTNVGADTNNFGNFTSAVSGCIGMYKSPNGRSYAVFANAQDGYNALVNDLKAKQSGNTGTGLNGNSTVEQLMGVWVNGGGTVDSSNSYAQRFYAASGLQPGTKLSQASADQLALGIMAGEGTLKAYQNGGVDLSSYANKNTTQGVNINSDPHTTSIGTTATGASVNAGGWITELEPYFSGQQKFMSTSDKTDVLKDFGINNQTYMEMMNKYADWFSNTQLKKVLEENIERAEDLLAWEKKENSGWGDLHSGMFDQASISNDANGNSNAIMGIVTEANAGYNKYKLLQNNQTLQTYLNLKAQGATFGAMQQAEWELIAGSVNQLNWTDKKANFKSVLEGLIQNYKGQLAGLGVSQDMVTEEDIMSYAYSNIQSPNLNSSYDMTGVNFILNN